MDGEERLGGGTYRPGTEAGSHGRLSDAGIRAMQARIGIPVRARGWEARGWWNTIGGDAIRIWAMAAGDANPLYVDPEYARRTRWGGPIASPTIVQAAGISEGRDLTQQERLEGAGGGLPGVHGWLASEEFEWYLPIREGDTLSKVSYLADVQEKQGRMSGRQVLTFTETIYRNQDFEVVCRRTGCAMRAERDAARNTGKYSYEPKAWTDEELAQVDAAILAERPRGAEPRYWEGVTVGAELEPLVRGPFTASEGIAFKAGWGGGFVKSGKLDFDARQRHPLAYSRSWLNIPDVAERVHWEHDFAREVGTPGLYDFGPQRTAWMGTLLTNWIGDDGWLKQLSLQVRRFNVEGDVQRFKGRVTAKRVVEGEHLVECEVWAENQRGEVTAPGRALIVLPSREHGPVRFPCTGQPPYPRWTEPDGRVVPVLTSRQS